MAQQCQGPRAWMIKSFFCSSPLFGRKGSEHPKCARGPRNINPAVSREVHFESLVIELILNVL